MSTVTYNSIPMDLVRTNQIDVVPIMSSDGTTYRFTEWTHDFVALLHPEVISFTAAGQERSGQMPAATIQGIRHALAQPQQTYTWTIGDDVVITSPVGDSLRDMQNGPVVEHLQIVAVNGVRAWQIHMRIKTWIHECAEKPVILSHRWRPSVTIDEHRYSTRSIIGEIQFHIPRLIELNRGADNYRVNMGHPVPDGFQRVGVRTAVSEGGGEVHYEITDQERATDIGRTFPFPDVDIQLTTGLTQGTQNSVGVSMLGGAISGFQSGATSAYMSSIAPKALRAPTFAIAGAAIGSLGSTLGELPRVYASCTTVIFGDRNSLLRDMVRYAAELSENRCAALGFFHGSLTEIQCQIQWTKKIVTWTTTHSVNAGTWASATGLDAIITNLDWLGQTIVNFFDPTANPNAPPIRGRPIASKFRDKLETLATGFSYGHGRFGGVAGNPALKSEGTAGSWLGKLVTQSLTEPCQGPSFSLLQTVYRNASKVDAKFEN